MKNISILGGGTSGWLTALYAKKIYEDRLLDNIEGNADNDLLKACQQFDEMNK